MRNSEYSLRNWPCERALCPQAMNSARRLVLPMAKAAPANLRSAIQVSTSLVSAGWRCNGCGSAAAIAGPDLDTVEGATRPPRKNQRFNMKLLRNASIDFKVN